MCPKTQEDVRTILPLCGFAQVASSLGVRAERSAGATVYAVIVFVTSVRVVGVRAERALSVGALIVRVV